MRKFRTTLFGIIVEVGFHLRLWQLILRLEKAFGCRRAVICLCYHNIEDGSGLEPISQMEKGTRASTLEAQVSTLTKWLKIIDDVRLADWLDRRERIESDSLLITFDDGYLDNYTVAYPILKRLNATGVIFIATQYIDSEKTFWWIRVSDAMRRITVEEWRQLGELNCPQPLTEILQSEDLISWESRCHARRRIAQLLDRLIDKESILSRLEASAKSASVRSMPLLSWKDIDSLRAVGVRFGAHTHSHPLLSVLSRDQIRDEIQTSDQILSRHLGESICSFAYPTGDYDVRVVEEMKLSKFRLGFTTKPGMILRGTGHYELPRIYLSRTRTADIYCVLALLKLAKYFPRIFSNIAIRLACS